MRSNVIFLLPRGKKWGNVQPAGGVKNPSHPGLANQNNRKEKKTMKTTVFRKLAYTVSAAAVLTCAGGAVYAQTAADVNYADREGETLLMKAADRGNVAEVTRLLQAGAAVNAKDFDGETALMI